MKRILSTWTGPVDFSMRDGAMRLSTQLLWVCLKMQPRFIGMLKQSSIRMGLTVILTSRVFRFRDIGYRHTPYFNCPNSPKCSGCTPGKFYDGEPFLAKEDCRPNYFKYVGTH